VEAPADGLWRIGRAPDPLDTGPPLAPQDLTDPKAGNRFDSPTGDYRVTYFGTTLDACYGETLARFRPDPALVEALGADAGFMLPGEVPADWRHRRLAVQVRVADTDRMRTAFPDGPTFLDVEDVQSRRRLASELADLLAYYGYDDLDVPTVRGRDRRITRWISRHAYDLRPQVAGIRYLSRLNSEWECWAVFDTAELLEVSRKPLLLSDDALVRVRGIFGLTIY
jgi:hypothetical protein